MYGNDNIALTSYLRCVFSMFICLFVFYCELMIKIFEILINLSMMFKASKSKYFKRMIKMLISYKSYINEKKLGQLFESGT